MDTQSITSRALFDAANVEFDSWCAFDSHGDAPTDREAAMLDRIAARAAEHGVADAPALVRNEWLRTRALHSAQETLVPSAMIDVARELDVPQWGAVAVATEAREKARQCLANASVFVASANWSPATEWVHEALAHLDTALCAAMDDGGTFARASAAWAAKLAARYEPDPAVLERASAEWRATVAAKSSASREMYARARVVTDPIRAKLLTKRGFAD